MYPNRPEMDFDCDCVIKNLKNVWNDYTGVHVRFCPMCSERREQFYEPLGVWADSGQGLEGRPEPDHIRRAREYSEAQRALGVTVRNPREVVSTTR